MDLNLTMKKLGRFCSNMESSGGWSLHTLHNKMDVLREITELSLKLQDAHIPEQKREKLDKKALKYVLIGYNGDDSYRLRHQESGDTKISRDVRLHLWKKIKPGI